jgi:hypothetical protein
MTMILTAADLSTLIHEIFFKSQKWYHERCDQFEDAVKKSFIGAEAINYAEANHDNLRNFQIENILFLIVGLLFIEKLNKNELIPNPETENNYVAYDRQLQVPPQFIERKAEIEDKDASKCLKHLSVKISEYMILLLEKYQASCDLNDDHVKKMCLIGTLLSENGIENRFGYNRGFEYMGESNQQWLLCQFCGIDERRLKIGRERPERTLNITQASELLSKELTDNITKKNVIEFCINSDEFHAYIEADQYNDNKIGSCSVPKIQSALDSGSIQWSYRYHYEGLLRLDKNEILKPIRASEKKNILNQSGMVFLSYKQSICQYIINPSPALIFRAGNTDVQPITATDLLFIEEELLDYAKSARSLESSQVSEEQTSIDCSSSKPRGNDFDYSGLLITPKKVDDWFQAIDDMTQNYYGKNSEMPNSAQAWAELCENPPTGYQIKHEQNRKKEYITMPGNEKLTKANFTKRWKRYTNKNQ